MELDRMESEYKTNHLQRSELIKRWQDIVSEMKKRDIEINKIGERFAEAKAERAKREKLIEISRKRKENQILENKEIESKFEMLSRIVSKKREELISGTLKLQDYKDELETIKNELIVTSDNLSIKNLKIKNLKVEIEKKKTQLSNNRAKSIIKNLNSSLVSLDRESSKQQELLYNAEFQIQQIERKIARGLGERSDEEKKHLKQQIETFEQLLSDIKEKKKILSAQLRKLSNELAIAKQKKDEESTKKTQLEEKLNSKEIENKLINDEIKIITKYVNP
eukprot:gene19826-25773_t